MCVATPAKVVKVQDLAPCLFVAPPIVKPFLVVDLLAKTANDPKYIGTVEEIDALMGWAADLAQYGVLAHKLCGPR